MAKQKLVTLEPRNDAARQNLGYHGDRWYLSGQVDNRQFSRDKGPFYVLRSRDGTRVLFVAFKNDRHFSVRIT